MRKPQKKLFLEAYCTPRDLFVAAFLGFIVSCGCFAAYTEELVTENRGLRYTICAMERKPTTTRPTPQSPGKLPRTVTF